MQPLECRSAQAAQQDRSGDNSILIELLRFATLRIASYFFALTDKEAVHCVA